MSKENEYIVILDNGHGRETPGKRSPDGKLREYAYAREIVQRIHKALEEKGIKSVILVPEQEDIALSERVRRANKIYNDNGKKAFLISVHCNAAGNGNWMNARGWSVHIDKTGSNSSKKLAGYLFDAAKELGLKTRQPSPQVKYITQGLYICRYTNCPAVLTENLFQDNKEDVAFMLSEDGKRTITDVHVNGIIKYLNS